MSPLLPLDVALSKLRQGARNSVSRVVSVPIADALGRVLAADQRAILDVPPMDNSAMDGYAVRSEDAGAALPESQRIAAGDLAAPLAPDTVARIFTGAPIPADADAVVIQEDVQRQGERIGLPSVIEKGQHIRVRGQDCLRGDLLVGRGRRLRPQDLGLLASQGINALPVFASLRVAVMCTGNELREPGSGHLPPGAIYNSNRPMLCALLASLGCEVVDLGIVADTREATRSALEQASKSADLVISSGGVSVGEADFVRDAVSSLGEITLWRVAMKPGKPFAHGRVGTTPFLGLPGNPVSAYVTFLLLARPFICAMQGRCDSEPRFFPVQADFSIRKPGTRAEYLRVNLHRQGNALLARAHENQSSGVLRSLSDSEALARIPLGATVAPGDWIDAVPLDTLLF